MNRIGIMQGRLLPPIEGQIQSFPHPDWADEFPRAQTAGLSFIEWIYDLASEETNPLCSASGTQKILKISKATGIAVESLCADYFMDRPLCGVTLAEREDSIERLRWLVGQSRKAGIRRIVLPFVDRSVIQNSREEEEAIESIMRVLAEAEQNGIQFHLETSLDPTAFARILSELPSDWIRVNYDSGNSASMGFDPADEFALYGSRIGSVHIKDRVAGGSTVDLGRGDTDFRKVFTGLQGLGYKGDFVLQVARGAPGDELASAIGHRDFVLRHWMGS